MVLWLLETMSQETTKVTEEESWMMLLATMEDQIMLSHSLDMVKRLELENGGKSKTPGENGGVKMVT